MHSRPNLLTIVILALALLGLAAPGVAQDDELSATFETLEAGVFNRIDDFAIDSCDPPCTGLICCDNGTCVHSILACGFHSILPESFRIDAAPGTQMAGYATQGALAAEYGKAARVWFGSLAGDAWDRLGVTPGHYELVLQDGATPDAVGVAVIDDNGREVARLGGHFWVFSTATDAAEWNLGFDGLEIVACHERRCVQLNIPLDA